MDEFAPGCSFGTCEKSHKYKFFPRLLSTIVARLSLFLVYVHVSNIVGGGGGGGLKVCR